MKFTSAILIGAAANLAAAAPFSVQPNTTPADSLAKRYATTSICGPEEYRLIGGNAAKNALWQLTGGPSGIPRKDTHSVTPGTCKMIACAGRASIRLCVDSTMSTLPVTFDSKDLGGKMDATYHDCFCGPPPPSNTAGRAYQYLDSSWTMVHGGEPSGCDQLDATVGDNGIFGRLAGLRGIPAPPAA